MPIDPRVILLAVAAYFLFVFPSAAFADAASELGAALARLENASYRKRDRIDGLGSLAPKSAPLITECSGAMSRMVFEIDAPTVGRIRQEQIRVGSRSAVRTISPGIVKQLEDARRSVSVNAARQLLRQIANAAVAIQTGGLSTASWIKEAATAALTIKTTADARNALDRALTGFNSWQLVKPEDDEEPLVLPQIPENVNGDDYLVEKAPPTEAGTAKYIRRPKLQFAGVSFHSVVVVDQKTGLPLAEENYVNGQRMMRTEYFDIGAAISIDLPDCLK